MSSQHNLRIGCAGQASDLERQSGIFSAIEIDASFDKPQSREAFARCAESVPPGFRFAVKLPRGLFNRDEVLKRVEGLGEKLGTLVMPLPSNLVFDAPTARGCFESLRKRFQGGVVVEPGDRSWFSQEADELFDALRIGRMATDPAPVPEAGFPGGWLGVAYFRLRGPSATVHSLYDGAFLKTLSTRLRGHLELGVNVWCIFDSVDRQGAIPNALETLRLLEQRRALSIAA